MFEWKYIKNYDQFKLARSCDMIEYICKICNNTFTREKRFIEKSAEKNANIYCSVTCQFKHNQKTINCKNCLKPFKAKGNALYCSFECYSQKRKQNKPSLNCECSNCKKQFHRPKSRIKRNRNNFCSHQCIISFSRKCSIGLRSKLEYVIEDSLKKRYPNLFIVFNDRECLNGLELDIYVPSLKIAFEINGPTHYTDRIYGIKNFEKTQERDARKKKICEDKNINLYVFDVSKPESNLVRFINVFNEIILQIDSKLYSPVFYLNHMYC